MIEIKTGYLVKPENFEQTVIHIQTHGLGNYSSAEITSVRFDVARDPEEKWETVITVPEHFASRPFKL